MVDQLLPSIRQVESVNSDCSTNVPYAFRPGPNLIHNNIVACIESIQFKNSLVVLFEHIARRDCTMFDQLGIKRH